MEADGTADGKPLMEGNRHTVLLPALYEPDPLIEAPPNRTAIRASKGLKATAAADEDPKCFPFSQRNFGKVLKSCLIQREREH